jgi:hypothetical protein
MCQFLSDRTSPNFILGLEQDELIQKTFKNFFVKKNDRKVLSMVFSKSDYAFAYEFDSIP